MERIYTIEQHDNGWSIGDDLGGSSVCEEKISDREHRKFKQFLGDCIYSDIDDNTEPDYYTYHKLVDKEFTLMLGSDILNYLYERKPNWLNKFK